MDHATFSQRVDAVKQAACGRWTDILRALGIEERILRRRNVPCPHCGGEDRFQFTDKFHHGDYHCRGCGHGDGFQLLMHVYGWDFSTALQQVERELGRFAPALPRSAQEDPSERMKTLAKRIWHEASPISKGDDVDRYLCNRGLDLARFPKCLRCHPALGFYEKDAAGRSRKVAEYPAMLAAVQALDGTVLTLHRTYLQDGRKAAGRESRKTLHAGYGGAAIQLFPATEELGIAEGIEDALAIHLRTGHPVWSALNCGNLERVVIPAQVRHVRIYADNDADAQFDGQASAYILARRLAKERVQGEARRIQVFVPQAGGSDWADIWLHRCRGLKSAA